MSTYRDQKIAEDAGLDRELRCTAHGCPRAWSNDFGVRLCSAHATCTGAHEWPRVTQQLIDADTERAMNPPAKRPPKYATKAQGLAALAKLRLMGSGDPRLWAKRLQWREEHGRPLSRFQREIWRDALGVEMPAAAQVEIDEPTPEVV